MPSGTAKRGPKTVDTLVSEGATILKKIGDLDGKRTVLYRSLAEVVFKLRSKFKTPDGQKDYTGRTVEYREAVQAMYEAANVLPDSQSNVQAAIRYHIGEVLRERLTPKELRALGLNVKSPKERANGRAKEEREAQVIDIRGHVNPKEFTNGLTVIDLRPEFVDEADATEVIRQASHVIQSARKKLHPETGQKRFVQALDKLIREATAYKEQIEGELAAA